MNDRRQTREDDQQSSGREENDAVPAWEITKGAGKKITEASTPAPDQSTSGVSPKPASRPD